MRWDGGGDGADVGDDVGDDLDDARDDDDGDGNDLPFREVISPTEFVRRRWPFLLCRFPPRLAAKLETPPSFRVFPPGGKKGRGGTEGGHHAARRVPCAP